MLKASAGASEHIPFFSIAHPNSFLDAVSQNGWKLYAAVPLPARSSPSSSSSLSRPYLSTTQLQSPLRQSPCLLLIGGEGKGLRWNLRKKADVDIGIAGGRKDRSNVDSLNVSVATGILCQAFLQKNGRRAMREDDGPEGTMVDGVKGDNANKATDKEQEQMF
jgi:21S rRNA (GM2251-2'-O)-methyltransferase